MSETHVLLYRATGRTEAQLMVLALESAGIRAVLAGGNSSQLRGYAAFADSMRVEVWVEEGCADQARKVIEGFQQQMREQETGNQQPWKCSACKEAIDAGFDLCWNCGAERPKNG